MMKALRAHALQLLLVFVLAKHSEGMVGKPLHDTFVLQVPLGSAEQVLIEARENGSTYHIPANVARLDVLSNDLLNSDFHTCHDTPRPSSLPPSDEEQAEELRFEEIASRSIGIEHEYRTQPPARPDCTFPQVTSNGDGSDGVRIDGELCTVDLLSAAVVAGDYNNDGYVDLFFTVHHGRSRLYKNRGDGTFEDVTAATKIGPQSHGSGAVWLDVDDDGDLDLYVTTLGDIRHYLYINQRNGQYFTEEAERRGMSLQQADKRPLAGMTPNVGDYDRDGFADVYVTEWMLGYVATPAASRLLRNRGPIRPGFFEDATERAGLQSIINSGSVPGTFTFCSSFTDMDNDGWQDLVVTGDYGTSHVFWNNGNGSFTECTGRCGVTASPDAMGHAIGDWNVDGYLDWWMTAIHDSTSFDCKSVGCKFSKAGNIFYANEGNRSLLDVTTHVGVREGFWGWGNALVDFNNDCWLDFVMTNGFDEASTTSDDRFRSQPMKLWENQGPENHGRAVDVSSKYNLVSKQSGRGLIKVDYDNDGDEDLIVANNVGPPSVFRNDGGNKNNWIKIKAMRRCFIMRKECFSLGSRVQVILDDGTTQTQEVGSGSHFMAQNELITHFGLGAQTHRVTVKVSFPHRHTTVIVTDIPVNKLIAVHEPFGFFQTVRLSYSSLRQCRHHEVMNVTQPSTGHVSINPDGQSLNLNVDLDQLGEEVKSSTEGIKQLDFTYQIGWGHGYQHNSGHHRNYHHGNGLTGSVTVYYVYANQHGALDSQCLPDGNVQSGLPPTKSDDRLYSGVSNNENNLLWGSAPRVLHRDFPPAYADGIDVPAGQCLGDTEEMFCPLSDTRLGTRSSRPSPRQISNVLFAQGQSMYNELGINDLHTQFGQFLAHDTDFTSPLPSIDPDANAAGLWLPISVPKGDVRFDRDDKGHKYLPFTRSIFSRQCTGKSYGVPRQQLNTITSVLDANQVYGTSEHRNQLLRSHEGGEMLVQTTRFGNMLPFNTFSLPNDNPVGRNGDRLLVAGDNRVNVQPGLMALHTLFVREHNRQCRLHRLHHPNASDEEVFQHARRFVIAEMQAITYHEYLPALLGEEIPPYTGYDRQINPDVGNVFATASFRFGHSQVNTHLWRLHENGTTVPEGHLLLREGYFAPERLLREGGLEPLFSGSVRQLAQKIDPKMVDEMRNVLFPRALNDHSHGLDLAAMNIQRGRDHGLPDYNTVREQLGLRRITSFEEITSDNSVAQSLRELYPTVDDIDVWVGGLAEDQETAHSSVGPTFARNLVENFRRIRAGDRFWYENVMKPEEIAQVNSMTLLEVIRQNTHLRLPTAQHSFFSPDHCRHVRGNHCIGDTEPTSDPESQAEHSGSGAAADEITTPTPDHETHHTDDGQDIGCQAQVISAKTISAIIERHQTVLIATINAVHFNASSAIATFRVAAVLRQSSPGISTRQLQVHDTVVQAWQSYQCQCINISLSHFVLLSNTDDSTFSLRPITVHHFAMLLRRAEDRQP